MSDDFDIYADLLGIPAGPRPPDYYQLLGVSPFETDIARIHAATRVRIAGLSALVGGAQAAAAQTLLAEIATARAALTTPVVKARYDAKLREKRGAGDAGVGAGRADDAGSVERGGAAARSDRKSEVNALLPPAAVDAVLLQETMAAEAAEMAAVAVPTPRVRTSPWAQPVTAPPPPPASAAPDAPAPAIVTARLVSGPGTAFQLAPPPAYSSAAFAPPDDPLPSVAQPDYPPLPASATIDESSAWHDALPPLASAPHVDPLFDHGRSPARSSKARQQNAQKAIFVTLGGVFVALAAIVAAGVVWQSSPNRVPEKSHVALADVPTEAHRGRSSSRSDTPQPAGASKPTPPPASIEKTPSRGMNPAAGRGPEDEGGAAPQPVPRKQPGDVPATDNPLPMKAGDPASREVAAPMQTQAVNKSLSEARQAIARRDFDAADEQLDLALLDASTDPLRSQVEGVKTLRHYVDRFWNAVGESMKTLDSGHEITVDGEIAILVEVSPDRKKMVIRLKGQNRSFNTRELPANLAVALAERWLATDDVNSKAFVGTFLAIDDQGDKARGRRLLNEAKTAGSEAAATVLEQLDR